MTSLQKVRRIVHARQALDGNTYIRLIAKGPVEGDPETVVAAFPGGLLEEDIRSLRISGNTAIFGFFGKLHLWDGAPDGAGAAAFGLFAGQHDLQSGAGAVGAVLVEGEGRPRDPGRRDPLCFVTDGKPRSCEAVIGGNVYKKEVGKQRRIEYTEKDFCPAARWGKGKKNGNFVYFGNVFGESDAGAVVCANLLFGDVRGNLLSRMAHAFVAYKLGDPTAKNMGRMSIDPFRHIDWIGAVMFVFFGFGWAKPVVVNSSRLKHFRRDDVLISLAGPL